MALCRFSARTPDTVTAPLAGHLWDFMTMVFCFLLPDNGRSMITWYNLLAPSLKSGRGVLTAVYVSSEFYTMRACG